MINVEWGVEHEVHSTLSVYMAAHSREQAETWVAESPTDTGLRWRTPAGEWMEGAPPTPVTVEDVARVIQEARMPSGGNLLASPAQITTLAEALLSRFNVTERKAE